MSPRILIALLIPFLFTNCKKEQDSNVRPTLSFVQFNNNIVATDAVVTAIINFTNNGRAIFDSIFIERISSVCPENVNVLESFKLPSFNSNLFTKGQFDIYFSTSLISTPSYITFQLPKCSPKEDTSVFKIWITDIAGNTSDTVTTPPLYILP
ncbi:MAG: hypothetical protein QM528_01880 [Phycisphaerales bacterium]|nr:hypothetical protein [Phycisphaerales bacterium]